MNGKKPLFIGFSSALAVVLVFTMSSVITESSYDIDRSDPARTVQMIEHHLQDGRTDLSSLQIPSVAKLLYEEAGLWNRLPARTGDHGDREQLPH
jgi:hypothetical protein